MVATHTAVPQSQVKLPNPSTKIYKCLLVVYAAYPGTILTQDVMTRAELNSKETAALMVLLMARGLVSRLEERRGLAGGSVWILTKTALNLIERKES